MKRIYFPLQLLQFLLPLLCIRSIIFICNCMLLYLIVDMGSGFVVLRYGVFFTILLSFVLNTNFIKIDYDYIVYINCIKHKTLNVLYGRDMLFL